MIDDDMASHLLHYSCGCCCIDLFFQIITVVLICAFCVSSQHLRGSHQSEWQLR